MRKIENSIIRRISFLLPIFWLAKSRSFIKFIFNENNN